MPGVVWREAVAKCVIRWSRRGFRSLFGARSRVVEEAGFKILWLPALWGLLVTGVLVVGLPFLLTVTTSYDSDNYRYALSAELQSVAAIFAIVLTGTLVAAQIVVSTTPRVMSYLPLRALILAILVNLVVMGADVAALARLPESATSIGRWAVNFVVVLNGAALAFTFGYVATALLWTRPETYLAAVLNRMDQADDLSSQQKAIVAIEELGRYGSERGHIQTCRDAVRAFEVAADLVLAKSNLDTEAVGQDISHPLRTIPEALGRLGAAYAERGLDDAVHPIAWSLGGLGAEYCARRESLVDIELVMAIEEIAESCGRHSRERALYNFLANKKRSLTWLAEGGAHEALRFWALNVETEADICARWKLPNAAAQVVEQVDALLTLAEKRQLRDYFYDGGVQEGVDWRDEIGGLLGHARVAFEKAGISGSTPWFERGTLSESIDAVSARLAALTGQTWDAEHDGSSPA